MRNLPVVLMVGGLALLSSFCCTRSRASGIQAVADSFPPFIYLDKDAKPAGFAWATLQQMFGDANMPTPALTLQAWTRAYKSVQESPQTLVIAMRRTPEREKLFKWIGPYYGEHVHLYRRSDMPILISHPQQLSLYRYGVKRGASDQLILLQLGVPATQIDSVDTDLQNLDKLWRRRVDLVPLLPIEMHYYQHFSPATTGTFDSAFQLPEPAPLFFAFNVAFDPIVFDKLSSSFAALHSRGVLDELVQQRYPKAHDMP